MGTRKLMFSQWWFFIVLNLFLAFGCASQQVKPESSDDIEARIDSLGKKLGDALRQRDLATDNLALIEESSIGKREISQFGIFTTDRLKQILTQNKFTVIDIKGVHWENILANKPIGTPETDCERKESPQVILLLNVKDYGQSSKIIYVTITAKRSDANRFIEGLVVEEKFNRSGRIVAWMNDRQQIPMPLGTESNPFETIDNGTEYLAKGICCPYRELLDRWDKGELGARNINPDDITLVVTAVNGSTRKIGSFEKRLMSKLKTYLIKDCRIENAVDFSDYALVDKQLIFYETEGTFKLDFTSSNREMFKPGTILLIAETFYSEETKVDVAIRASWMKSEVETVVGDVKRVGGTYLPGFASSAYFLCENDGGYDGQIRNVVLSLNGGKGSSYLNELMEGELVSQGYRVVSENSKGKKIRVEGEIRTDQCFEELDSLCYDFFLRSLKLIDPKGRLIKTLSVMNKQGREKYAGHSQPTEDEDYAIRSGINQLWGSVKNDFIGAIKGYTGPEG